MPFRTAMPNRVMKPTSVAMFSTPPVTITAKTPPTSARGRFTMTRSVWRTDRNSMNSRRRMAARDSRDRRMIRRVACSADSNCPPYSM
jgi:hypothetical protein